MPIRASRERPEKILVAMYRLSGGSGSPLKYEDIVVQAFKDFPDEFALRGHPEYPDSSDIHKPLYGVLKRQGLVRSANKTFSLTPRGVESAERLVRAAGQALGQPRSPDRLTRPDEAELERMAGSEAFRRFTAGEQATILDTDFYAFFGCTVRTARNDFIGRRSACLAAVAAARKLGKPDPKTASQLEAVIDFMDEQFKREIEWKVKPNA